jgi:aminoglycoside phosphotransferase (APT) family kinase protein
MLEDTGNTATPKAEVEINVPLVRALLDAQHPHLADLSIRPAGTGWDNAMFRLGDAYALRLPRRALAADLIRHEQRWLPELANRLPLPVPAPVRVGVPGCGYPWHWSVVPWLNGSTADLDEPDPGQAEPLAAFLTALHIAAPPDAPTNKFRSVPLAEKAAGIETRMARLRPKTDLLTEPVTHAWEEALATPIDAALTWIHGDLHARNVLVQNGEISGIVDWGDVTSGDPATDLAAIWMLLPNPGSRQHAMRTYAQASEETWRRAKGWAVLFGVILLDTGLADHPQHAAMGERTLRQIAEGP